MINYIKNHYKEILLILIYSIVAYGLYFNAHYVHDSYRIYNFGFWQNLEGFFRQGRIFSMLFNMLFYILHISPRIGQIISLILLIIFLEISTLIIYNLILKRLEKKYTNIDNKFIILLICTGIFFNIYITEWMMFFEGCIIALGTLLSVISTYFMVEKTGIKKYILSSLFLVLGVFCYQASIVIGGALTIVLLLYDNKDEKIIRLAKRIIISMIPYVIALITNFIFVKIVNFSSGTDGRLSGSIDIFYNIFFVIKQILWYFVKMFNFPFNYIICFISLFCIVFYIINNKKEKKIYLLYYLISLFCLWILSVLPITVMPTGSQYFVARSIPYMASVVPFSLICTILFTDFNLSKNKIIRIITLIYSIVVMTACIHITSECLKNNAQDILIAKSIQVEIEKYELNTGNIINTIILLPDRDISESNKGINYYGDNSVRALCTDFSAKEIMYFVSKRYYDIYNGTIEEKIELFGNTEWNEFNVLEQLKFNNNILYLINY